MIIYRSDKTMDNQGMPPRLKSPRRLDNARRVAKLQQLIDAVGGSASKLAEVTPFSEAQISHWRTGFRGISNSTASRLETARGKPAGWMDEDDDPQTAVGDHVPRKVPLIALGEVRRHIESMEAATKQDVADSVVHDDASLDRRAFAIKVRGDSMVSTEGKRSFPEDCVIIVEPTDTAEPGEHVIVQFPTAKEAVFKKLVEFDGQLWLTTLNSRYPNQPLADAQILGVVVSVQHHEAIPRLTRAPKK